MSTGGAYSKVRRAARAGLPSLGRVRSHWLRLRPLLGERTRPVVVIAGASIGSGLAEAGVLALVAQVAAAIVVNDGRVRADLGSITLDLPVGSALAVAFALAAIRLVLQLVVAWLPARISADVQARLRYGLFASFCGTTWPVQADEPDGHLQELMTSQVAQATMAVIYVTSLLSGGAMFLTLAVSAFVLSVPVALVVVLSAPAFFALLRPLNRRGRLAAEALSQADLHHAAGVSESVRLAEEAHVFGAGDAYRAHVGTLIDMTRAAYFRFQLASRLASTSHQSLTILLVVGSLAGLYAVDAGNLASLGAAVLILVRAGTYGQQLQAAYQGLNQMIPYLERLEGVVARYHAAVEPDGGRSLPAIHGVGFEGVGFAYREGRPVLRDVSVEIHGGEAIGVVGPSGAGKSTLVQLLLRLRQPDTGRFVVNGEPAESFARADWQRKVAYVSQEPRVFQASVADNIRYFRDLDDAAVRRAAQLAHIHDDVMAMPDGYDTVIGQRSDAVSGGQRQRICLARALAAKPDLLVLDEPTSALDSASEAAVQASLGALHGQVTLIIVAHRLSTLSICDRVLVLGDGAIEAFDSAAALVATNDFYRRATSLSGGMI